MLVAVEQIATGTAQAFLEGVGYDGVDVPWCKAHGIAVSHSQGLNADDVADHAVGAFLAAWRGIVAGDRIVREGRWTHAERMRPRAGLNGRKAGIVGLGHIGMAIARRVGALALGMGVSLSAGGSLWPRDNHEQSVLFSEAEAALIDAKRGGRGRAVIDGTEAPMVFVAPGDDDSG